MASCADRLDAAGWEIVICAGSDLRNPVGADAYIGPVYTVRIRRKHSVSGTLPRGAMWASPPTDGPIHLTAKLHPPELLAKTEKRKNECADPLDTRRRLVVLYSVIPHILLPGGNDLYIKTFQKRKEANTIMKKKIIALCLIVALAATAVIGGTLAYFTDSDDATNTFTVGGVKIALVEQQRGLKDGEKTLVPFVNNKNLMPIVGSAQGAKETVDGVEMPTAENYVDKIISIKNTGVSDAYVRVFVAVPTALQNGQTPNAPRYDVLHWNFNGDSCATGEWTNEIVVANPTVIKGVDYKIYSRTYTTALGKDEMTATPAYIGFYLDESVDMNDQNQYTVNFGTGREVINYDLSQGVEIPVFAQAIQADGFDSAEAAFAASGLPSNPWA